MKKLYFLLVMSIGLGSCQNDQPIKNDKKVKLNPISDVFNNYHEENLKLFPLSATFEGDNRYNNLLHNDQTQEFRQKLKDFYSKYLTQLEKYDLEKLSDKEKMSKAVLSWECRNKLEDLAFDTHLTPIAQFHSLPLTMGQLAGGESAQPFKTAEDYENWLERLDSFTEWCDTAIENMKKGMAKGYVLPKALTAKVIPQMESFAKGPVEKHIFYKPILNFTDSIGEDDRKRLDDAYKSTIIEKIIPTFEKLHSFFKNEYLNASRESTGISEIPDGLAYYQSQIKTYTTTDMTPDEVFELGKKEVERLESEMNKIKDEVGFKGDLKAFFEHVRNKKELKPFKKPEEVIANFKAIHEKMKPNLAKYFDLVPKTSFEIRRTEAFREKSASAEYNPGTKDGSRPGIFYVPIPNVKEYNVFSDEDLFLHEAIPGHHYQISLQQEDEDLPQFRRSLWYSAYGEGWALYSESLGKELGLYKDPYQYFGMLSAEMHRAIRLVVDAGMHTKGWTREQAIQYSLDHEAGSEDWITSEIERYMSWPGQALSYKIGQLKLLELRARCEEKLGDRFNIKEFHNKILESGCVPLKILEDKINDWIKSENVKS